MEHVQRGGVGGNQYKAFREGPEGSWVHGPPGRRAKKIGRQQAAPNANCRVKLPNRFEDEDDMDEDEYDPEAENALDVIERMKIKHQNEMKRSK